MARRPSPWWSSRYVATVFLPRTYQVGAPWLSRSVTSGSARHTARRRARMSSDTVRESASIARVIAGDGGSGLARWAGED
jgi:hypothetical protein